MQVVAGFASPINGTTYAGAGGKGGGGPGNNTPGGLAGSANTGNGGDGGGNPNSGSGGSGGSGIVVVIKELAVPKRAPACMWSLEEQSL